MSMTRQIGLFFVRQQHERREQGRARLLGEKNESYSPQEAGRLGCRCECCWRCLGGFACGGWGVVGKPSSWHRRPGE